ncbi:MAG: hypothetical protein V2A53_04280 [bacterium]
MAQSEVSLIKLEREKGWLASGGLVYSSNVGEYVQMRVAEPSFIGGFIFNKNWSFFSAVPFRYEHASYAYIPGMQEKKTEGLFSLGNIAIIPRYRFEKKGKWIEIPLAIQFPTLNKISGNLQYEDIEKEGRIFAIEPAIEISKVSDPIVSFIRFSFAQPLWREKDKYKVYDLWKANTSAELYFLVNEQFSYFSNLGIYIGKKKEGILLEGGVAYHSKPYQEWRLSLLNGYDCSRWGSSMGLSFTMMQKAKVK